MVLFIITVRVKLSLIYVRGFLTVREENGAASRRGPSCSSHSNIIVINNSRPNYSTTAAI